MGRRPRRGRRLQGPAPKGQSGSYEFRSGASSFSRRHVNAESWELGVRTADNWLTKGASLLRAAAILHETMVAEGLAAAPNRATIGEQVVFCAALAAENALKAIIMSRTEFRSPLTGKFPEFIQGHSLRALAETAVFSALNLVEDDALDHGEDYIEWIGRYPTGVRPESVAAGRSMSPGPLFEAYRAIFHRAVEIVARENTARGRAPRSFTAGEWIERQRRHFLELVSS